jgi:hypothetical protein
MSGYATAQKILRAGYFCPSLFKDCITIVQKCHAFQMYNNKIRSHPTPLHPVVSVGPFTKWGIDFMTCNPHSVEGHVYIIVAVDYFTKWAEAMPTFNNTRKIQPYSYSIISSLDLESCKLSSLITVDIFKIS